MNLKVESRRKTSCVSLIFNSSREVTFFWLANLNLKRFASPEETTTANKMTTEKNVCLPSSMRLIWFNRATHESLSMTNSDPPPRCMSSVNNLEIFFLAPTEIEKKRARKRKKPLSRRRRQRDKKKRFIFLNSISKHNISRLIYVLLRCKKGIKIRNSLEVQYQSWIIRNCNVSRERVKWGNRKRCCISSTAAANRKLNNASPQSTTKKIVFLWFCQTVFVRGSKIISFTFISIAICRN